jgi:hypothetical protein
MTLDMGHDFWMLDDSGNNATYVGIKYFTSLEDLWNSFKDLPEMK